MNRCQETVEPMTIGLVVSVLASAVIVALLAPPGLAGAPVDPEGAKERDTAAVAAPSLSTAERWAALSLTPGTSAAGVSVREAAARRPPADRGTGRRTTLLSGLLPEPDGSATLHAPEHRGVGVSIELSP